MTAPHVRSHRRLSTAGDASPNAVMRQLSDHLGTGIILNLGSGNTVSWEHDGTRTYVHCDLAEVGGGADRFVRGDAMYLPFATGGIDGVLAKDVLEHVDDVLSVLGELHRVARAEGRLVLTVPRAVPRAVWADVTHKRGFTSDALEKALTLTGWRVSRRCRIGSVPGIRRCGLERYLLNVLQVPGLGHRFGTNWLVIAERQP